MTVVRQRSTREQRVTTPSGTNPVKPQQQLHRQATSQTERTAQRHIRRIAAAVAPLIATVVLAGRRRPRWQSLEQRQSNGQASLHRVNDGTTRERKPGRSRTRGRNLGVRRAAAIWQRREVAA